MSSLLFSSYSKIIIKSNAIYVPIFMYHQIKNNSLGKNTISPYELESDLKYLSENGYNTISISQLINYVYNDDELPPNPVILTFDDGYLNTYVEVFPLLRKYNMKIVVSVIGKSLDDFSKVGHNDLKYYHMTWEQLKEMVDIGCAEIQNHSYDMHKYTNDRVGCRQAMSENYSNYKIYLENDLIKLQNEIENKIGIRPTTFTYPFGAYSKSTASILKELGFKASLSCNYGINKITDDPDSIFNLCRICREHGKSISKYLEEIRLLIPKGYRK